MRKEIELAVRREILGLDYSDLMELRSLVDRIQKLYGEECDRCRKDHERQLKEVQEIALAQAKELKTIKGDGGGNT